jgi:hypothetical protein
MSGGAGVTLSSSSYVIFTVNIPEDGMYSVFLYAYSCGEQVPKKKKNEKMSGRGDRGRGERERGERAG